MPVDGAEVHVSKIQEHFDKKYPFNAWLTPIKNPIVNNFAGKANNKENEWLIELKKELKVNLRDYLKN